MTLADTEAAKIARKADREIYYGLGIFALFWLVVACGSYVAWPAIGCLNELVSNKPEICKRALQRPYQPKWLQTELRTKLVTALMSEEAYLETLDIIAEQEKNVPLTSALLLDRALALRKMDQPKEAILAYHAVLLVDKGNEDAATALVQLGIDAEKLDDARREATSFLTANPNSWLVISWLGWVEHLDRQNDTAVTHYKRAMLINATEPFLFKDLGLIYKDLGEAQNAIATYTAGLELSPYDTDFLRRRASIYDSQDEYRLAQADFEIALAQDRGHETVVDLGRSYTNSKDYEKAKALFDEVIAAEPEYEWAHESKIRMLFRQQRYDEARIAIAVLRKVVPSSVGAVYWQASIDDELGNYAEALKGYQTALESWKDDKSTLIDIGHVLVQLDRASEAMVYFDKAVQQNPKDDYALASRARAQLALNNWPAAIADANASITLKPNQSVAYARRAFAQSKLGQLENAQTSYELAARNDFEIEWVQRENLDFLMENNFLEKAKLALTRLRKETPNAPMIAQYEDMLRKRGVAIP
jgi:tetratricopeptide (TPR) repeat protein